MKTTTHASTQGTKDFNQRLRDTLTIEDQVDLGLIRNPIYDNHQVVEEIKQSLNCYDDATADQLGIEYAGELTANDEPDEAELQRALDLDSLAQIKETLTPETKRNNFRYVDKQRNEQDGYTRYCLANGDDRIIYDQELIDNPRLNIQRQMSDAWEEADHELYNQMKEEKNKLRTSLYSNETTNNEPIQCFIKVGTKLYGDVVNLPTHLLKGVTRKSIDANKRRQLISYLDMFQSPVKQLLKLQTKIKLVNINYKTIAIL